MTKKSTGRRKKPQQDGSLSYVNLGTTGAVSVAHAHTWQKIPTTFLKDCIAHTLATNGGKPLRKTVEFAQRWTLVAVWLRDREGTEWCVTHVSDVPLHFNMVPEAERRAAELESARNRADRAAA